MKQEISPKLFIVIIAAAVVIIGGLALWVWHAPSAHAVATDVVHPHPGAVGEKAAEYRAAHDRSQRQNGGSQ